MLRSRRERRRTECQVIEGEPFELLAEMFGTIVSVLSGPHRVGDAGRRDDQRERPKGDLAV